MPCFYFGLYTSVFLFTVVFGKKEEISASSSIYFQKFGLAGHFSHIETRGKFGGNV